MPIVVYGFDTDNLTPVISNRNLSYLGSQIVASEEFSVGAGGQTLFQLTTDIDATQKIDVSVNGRLKREGASHDYQRDAANNRIDFNYSVLEDGYVYIVIYSSDTISDSNYDVGVGGETEFSVIGLDDSKTLDVWVNGRLKREGSEHDYLRDSANEKITFNYTVLQGAWVRVRLS